MTPDSQLDPGTIAPLHEPYRVPAEFAPSAAHPIRVRSRPMTAGSHVGHHVHSWGQLAYSSRGALRMATRDTTWIVPPSRALWIAPDVVHKLVIVQDAYLRTVYVEEKTARAAHPACRVIEVSGLLREVIAALDQPALPAAREAWLGHLLLDELSRTEALPLSVPLPAEKRLRSLCEAILAEPGRGDSLDAWAGHVGASTRTIARLFRQELGMSFSQWRQQAVLAHAIPLVSQGAPLAKVAAELGYASQSAFSAMFRRAFGESPREFFARGTGNGSSPGPEEKDVRNAD
jgi:AraC-like DNA-binding protein